MQIKEGAIISGLQLQMRDTLIIADNIYSSFMQELVVTCGLDGVHLPGSLHYYGYAIDCRTSYFTKADRYSVYALIKTQLKAISPYFDIVLHDTHIHIEFDIIRYNKHRGIS